MASSGKYVSVNFEVFGRVQGVFFRKYTEAQAVKLGLGGWCRNTHNGTVEGTLQGSVASVDEMKKWLREVGSPKSHIKCVQFSQEHALESKPLEPFAVRN